MGGKVIVITGASSGIGAALARQMGRQGYRLVLAARREQELNKVAQETGSNALPVKTDVTRRQEVEHLKQAAIEAFGRVDIWVNNAGRGISKKVLELSDEDLDEMIAVNLKSALYGIQVIIPHFQQRGEGHLINVSSFLGRVPLVSFRSAYNAAKAALNALTANLRTDLKVTHPKIHVSLVMPGIVATEFASRALGGAPQVPSAGGRIQPQSPEEVAALIATLVENPKPEIYTNPALAETCRQYYQDVGAFEENLRR